MAIQKDGFQSEAKRYAGAVVLVLVAFIGAYNFAAASSQANAAGSANGFAGAGGTCCSTGASGGSAAGFAGAQGAGGSCCSTGGSAAGGGWAGQGAGAAGAGGCCGTGSSTPIEAETTVEGDVQRITVDTATGSFDPNIIYATAGVPIEIDFTQAPGGCLAGVYFPDFDIIERLTDGPKTVTLPALEPGEYTFYCQMQMLSGTIVVE